MSLLESLNEIGNNIFNNISNMTENYDDLTDEQGDYVKAEAAIQKIPIPEEQHRHLKEQKTNNDKLTDSGYTISEKLEKHICVPRYKVGGGAWTVIASAGSSYWILPVPQQLNYNSAFQWSVEDLGHGAAVTANSIASAINGGSLAKAAGNMVFGGGEAALNAAGRSMIQKTADAFGMNGQALLKEGEKQLGIAYNPNKQLYFNGVEQRQFTLNFSLAPTSKEEANAIRDGFYKLVLAASPEYNSSEFYFTYPNFFKISVIISNDGDNTHTLMERSRLAITDVSLDLASDGPMTWHEDGFPTSLSLSISFQESEIPTRGNLAKITLFGKPIQ